jgi:hypothetical protein
MRHMSLDRRIVTFVRSHEGDISVRIVFVHAANFGFGPLGWDALGYAQASFNDVSSSGVITVGFGPALLAFGPFGWAALGFVLGDISVTSLRASRNELHSSLVAGVGTIAGF